MSNKSTSDREDEINATHEVLRVQVGHKFIDGETLYRIISVRGNDTLGYIATSEEWFTAESKIAPEFYDVRFETSIYPNAKAALVDAIPSAFQEAEASGFTIDIELAGYEITVNPSYRKPTIFQPFEENKPQEIEMKPVLNPKEFEITSGYVGSMGVSYETTTEDSLRDAIEKAAQRNNKSSNEITELLLDGKMIAWQNSPNHYYDHGVGVIRRRRTAKPVEMVKCDCGHSVPRSQRMSASMGSSCPDCYDQMSN